MYVIELIIIKIAKFNILKFKQMINSKPNLIKIAWMRNWFQDWLSMTWIGNYDILFTTSTISSNFFQSFNEYPIVCYNKCPNPLKGIRKRKSINGLINLLIYFSLIQLTNLLTSYSLLYIVYFIFILISIS